MKLFNWKQLLMCDRGMTTAEYAVGTVAAAGLGSVLLKILLSPEVKALIMRVLEHAFSFLFGQ